MTGSRVEPLRIADSVASPRVSRRALRVEWFDGWHATLDEALAELPEMETCPHELLRTLATSPSQTRKRTALVTHRGSPAALVCLRRKQWHWEPVGQWVTPYSIAPVRDGYLFPALAALGVDVRLEACQERPPTWATVNGVSSTPVYKMHRTADFERYWRETGQLGAIRPAQRRAKRFQFVVDRPGAAAWTISNWAEKWRDHPYQETIVAEDQLIAAEYYQNRGQYHTFELLDGERPTVGYTFFAHRRDILFLHTYRDPAYDRYRVGTRAMQLIFEWAAARPELEKIDLGSHHAYKAGWAPQDGEEWSYNVSPLPIRARRLVTRLGRRALRSARSLPGLVSRLRPRAGNGGEAVEEES